MLYIWVQLLIRLLSTRKTSSPDAQGASTPAAPSGEDPVAGTSLPLPAESTGAALDTETPLRTDDFLIISVLIRNADLAGNVWDISLIRLTEVFPVSSLG